MSVRCEAVSNRTGDWFPFCDKSQNGNPSRIIGRNDFLILTGTIAVIAGLLFPLKGHILDVLLIFSLSLTAAVVIITFSARAALQVLGFPLLIVLATMLRMALSLACSKLTLSQANTGTIISVFGTILVRSNCVLAILVFGVLTVVIFGIICKAAKGVSRIASEFTANIVPIKQISIDSDLNAEVIDNSQALKLRGKIAREAGFFVAMSGAAKFMLCCATIELAAIIVNIVGGMAIGTVTPTTAEMSVKTYATLAIGAGTITQISALLVAVASLYLVRKSLTSPAANMRISEQEFTKRIEVIAREVGCSQAIESQYGNIKAEKKVITEDLEWFDEPTAGEKEKDDVSLWSLENAKDSDYYDTIAELIASKSADEAKTILIAAESIQELPVTIPVNIAIHLAQKGQKCLLIDLDLERDAISKVFDVDSTDHTDKVQTKAMATTTCISNLWIWPASNFGKSDRDVDVTNINDVITTLKSHYDRLIIYAPNVGMPASDDRDRIASRAQAAMLFGKEPGPQDKFEGSAINDFHKLLISYGCAILKPAEVFAETA
ncbi:MAG: FHIPEP family type III secretion protein [Planctomycetota bacterium]|jgi:Mrp family chromosome partitioning ATPase